MGPKRSDKCRHKVFLALAGLIFSACAVNHSSESYKDSYQFEADCDTGEHEFESDDQGELQEKICVALQNETLNRGCAREMRRKHFEQKCPGSQWSPK